ncbi:MAG TPA: DUF6220 domain-containing protein [Rubrobacter sp.]|jgi:hypothetical protein|nr:DUF6220 domain-containing protein [Rubrobacter sp.]
MLRTARLAYRTLAGLFVAGTVTQFFLAGLGVFGAASFGAHATLGTILGIVSLVLLLLAGVLVFAGGLEKRTAGVAALLVVLMVVQYSLVELFSETAPALAALHPVNGLLVLGVACSLAFGLRPSPSAARSRA